jgi:putative redox protein
VVTAVPTDQLAATIETIRTDWSQLAEAPIATFVAETRLVDGFATAADVRQFGLTVDEPPTLGGSDRGPTPVELVLTALGTCQEIVYATYARVLGIPVDAVTVKVEGRLDPRGFFGVADVPAGFQDIAFEVDITSPAEPEAIGHLVATVNAHCPVLDILRQPVPVTGRYQLNGIPVAPADHPEPVLPTGVAA